MIINKDGTYTIIDVYETVRGLRASYKNEADEIEKQFSFVEIENEAEQEKAKAYLQVYENLGRVLMYLAPFTEGPEALTKKTLPAHITTPK